MIRSLFLQSHIAIAVLTLPPLGDDGKPRAETQGELLRKHREGALEIGVEAARTALERAGLTAADVSYLACVTTTGYLTPGLSALFLEPLGLPARTGRVDVVGMGCNAGLNGLQPVAHWAAANPGRFGLLVCVEICSAAYVMDDTVGTAVVNSLFGDGAAAAVIGTAPTAGPAVLDSRASNTGAVDPGGRARLPGPVAASTPASSTPSPSRRSSSSRS